MTAWQTNLKIVISHNRCGIYNDDDLTTITGTQAKVTVDADRCKIKQWREKHGT